jgi:hypothetical protein
MYHSVGAGNAGSSGTGQASSSTAAINPCFTSFCRWPGVMVEGVQSCSTMVQGGRECNNFEILIFLPISFFPRFLLFPPLFLFPGVGKERMTDGVQGYRGAQGRPLALNPMSSVVKRLGPLRCSKGPGKLSLPTFPIPCTSHQLQQQGIQKPYPQWAPRRQGGSAKAQGLKAKPARRVRAAQSNQSDGRSVTKGGHQLVHLVLH